MLEELYNPKQYPHGMSEKIETMGAVTVSIANRWSLGWPTRVKKLIASGEYLAALENQADQEKNMLAVAANMTHLAPREIRELYELSEAPPTSQHE